MFCKNCGKQMRDDEAFCMSCGTQVQPSNTPPPNMPPPNMPPPMMPPKKTSGKGLMIALICVSSAAVLAFAVFAYFTWIQPPKTSVVGSDQPPEVLSTQAVRETPAPSMQQTPEQTPEQTFAPTTQVFSEKILGAWETDDDGTYVALEFFDDGTAIFTQDTDQGNYTYIIANNTLVLTSEMGESFEIEIGFKEEDGEEYMSMSADGEYHEMLRVDAISPPAATQAPTQASALPTSGLSTDVVFANGFVEDVETYLSETWWTSTGTWVDNPTAPVQAPGYPKVYEVSKGQLQYIFDTSAMTVQTLAQQADGSITDHGLSEYTIDPRGFFLYTFNRVENLEGVDYSIMSMFFVCDDVLYEVEVVDNMEATNYIAYEISGP